MAELEATANEDIELLTVSEAARLTRLNRETIKAAMDRWEASRGRLGLAFVRPVRRRMVRRAALRDWFEAGERSCAYGG